MPDDDEDLDRMSPERLRALQREVLDLIEEIGSRAGAVDPDAAKEIARLDDLLKEIEERLSGPSDLGPIPPKLASRASRGIRQPMRPALLDPLFAPAATLPGVGPKIAKLLDRLLDRPQGARVIDVLFHLPYATLDRRARPKIRDAARDAIATIEVRVAEHRPPPSPRSKAPFKVLVEDETGDVELVFFLANHEWIEQAAAARRDALGLRQARNVGRPSADGPSRPGDGRRRARAECRRSSRSTG